MAQRVVYRQFQFTRPRLVHRPPAEAAALWRARLPRYLLMTACWAVGTVTWAATDGATSLVTVLTGAACVLHLAVCVKAFVLIRRGEGATP